jgi:hypothetical protein
MIRSALKAVRTFPVGNPEAAMPLLIERMSLYYYMRNIYYLRRIYYA